MRPTRSGSSLTSYGKFTQEVWPWDTTYDWSPDLVCRQLWIPVGLHSEASDSQDQGHNIQGT